MCLPGDYLLKHSYIVSILLSCIFPADVTLKIVTLEIAQEKDSIEEYEFSSFFLSWQANSALKFGDIPADILIFEYLFQGHLFFMLS